MVSSVGAHYFSRTMKTLLAALLFAVPAFAAPLKVTPIVGSPQGFFVTSTLVSGEKEALLIDGAFTLADAQNLATFAKQKHLGLIAFWAINRDQPGSNIAGHLNRRGLPAEVRNVDSAGRSASSAILEEAQKFNADLIVMGGYAHSRLRELVFGGATRELLRTTTIPLLMAH